MSKTKLKPSQGVETIKETLEAILDAHQQEVDSLEAKIEEANERELGESIDCGIGTIRYEADSLDLQMLMESLAEAIKEHGYKDVMSTLKEVYSV